MKSNRPTTTAFNVMFRYRFLIFDRQKYVDNNGNDRTIPDIYVQELKIIG